MLCPMVSTTSIQLHKSCRECKSFIYLVFGYLVHRIPEMRFNREKPKRNRDSDATIEKINAEQVPREIQYHSREKQQTLGIQSRRWENNTITADKNDGDTFCEGLLRRSTSQNFRAAYFDERRGHATKEYGYGLRLGEVFAVQRQHLRRMRIGFAENGTGACAVCFWSLRSAVRRQVLHHAGEGSHRLRRDRERSGLRCVLVIEQDGGHVEIVSNLVCARATRQSMINITIGKTSLELTCANDSPHARFSNVDLPKRTRCCGGVATRPTTAGSCGSRGVGPASALL